VSTYAEEVVLLSVDIAVIRALKDGALPPHIKPHHTIGERGVGGKGGKRTHKKTNTNIVIAIVSVVYGRLRPPTL
jgi:hypothetical protein